MGLSPMMSHYLQKKQEYPDCILMYRLGDFYEMFFEDAELVSKELNLVLTGRDCGVDKRAPMCGVPAHAMEGYLSELVSKGYKVAICEQLTAPQKGVMVERDVLRVVTPGTVIESNILDSNKNNYLVSIAGDDNGIGLSYLDVSTGAFYAEKLDASDLGGLNDELLRIAPAEIICNQYIMDLASGLGGVIIGTLPKFFKYFDWAFNKDSATKAIQRQYNITELKGSDLFDNNEIISAVGSLLEYVHNTQKRDLAHILPVRILRNDNYMYLDANARRNLELITTMRDNKKKGSLLDVLDNTDTKMGARYLRTLIEQPLQSSKEINARLQAVEELIKNILPKQALKDALKQILDIERITGKLCYNTIIPKECVNFKHTLAQVRDVKVILEQFNSPLLREINDNIADFEQLIDILDAAFTDEGYLENRLEAQTAGKKEKKRLAPNIIKSGYNKQLDELRLMMSDTIQWINNLEQVERQNTGLDLTIGFNKVYGYYIEVSKALADKVPMRYIRKQTVSGKDRYVTEELNTLETQLSQAEEKTQELQAMLFDNIKKILKDNTNVFLKTAQNIGLLDVLVSFATNATKYNYTKPEISDKYTALEIKDGRHPVVEVLSKDNFVPNDILLDDSENRIMIITGPNMAGKSTFMRQTAIIVLMAHMGSFVPASSAKVPIFDRIFTRVGASDDLAFGQSTFMVEMSEVSNIINNASKRSLVILDEVGRGTSTYDGLSIAWAIMEYIAKDLKCKTLFATHYHELTDLENMLEGVKNYRINVKEFNDTIIFLRKIVRGGANKSFGIEVAQLAGVSKDIILRAKEILSLLQANERANLKNICENTDLIQVVENDDNKLAQIKELLSDVDINYITPFMAMEMVNNILNILNNKKG